MSDICPLCEQDVVFSEGDVPSYIGSAPVHMVCIISLEDGGMPPEEIEDY